jgi:hypothetical protein
LPYWMDRRLGPYASLLRKWGIILSSTAAITSFLREAPEEVKACPTTWLKSIVKMWDDEANLEDRVIALLALRDGWWPERMTTSHGKITVADVVDPGKALGQGGATREVRQAV